MRLKRGGLIISAPAVTLKNLAGIHLNKEVEVITTGPRLTDGPAHDVLQLPLQ